MALSNRHQKWFEAGVEQLLLFSVVKTKEEQASNLVNNENEVIDETEMNVLFRTFLASYLENSRFFSLAVFLSFLLRLFSRLAHLVFETL